MRQPSSFFRSATTWILVAAALAVVAPFALRGTACGHDLTFHMNSWMEVAQQWREGVLYPRWAAYANYGSGEPRFVFYPPLSGMLGAALGTVLHLLHIPASWMYAPAAFIVCAVVLSGLAMHRLAREWLPEPAATLAAVAYAVNPYALLTIYVRSAFAELLAACFLPLIFLWIVCDRSSRRMVVPLALTVAGVWLTDVPAAIIASYTAAVLLVVMMVLRRSSRVLLYGVLGIVVGLALAAFYIVPVLFEKRWIDVTNALSPGVRPFENFLFTRIGEPEHDRFIWTLSWVAVSEIAVTVFAMIGVRRWPETHPRRWWSLAVTTAMAIVLMLPVTNFAYRLLPDLRFLQFPWRWLIVVGVAYASSLAGIFSGVRYRPWVFAPAFLVLIFCFNYLLQPKCYPQDTPFMISELYQTGFGYKGSDEYVLRGADIDEIKPDFPAYCLLEAAEAAPAGVRVSQQEGSAYHKHWVLESPQPVTMELRLMNYPAWRVEVNGARVQPQSDDPTGRMVLSLGAGHSEIDARFVATPDRWAGDAISFAAVIFVGAFWYVERRRRA